MDQWVQKLSLVIVFITGAFTIHAMRKGAECWCPAQFTRSHINYANTLCSSNRTNRFQPPADHVPPSENTQHLEPAPSLMSEDNTLLKVITGELLLICALYSLVKCIISTSNFDVIFPANLHVSYSKAPIYIIVQLAGCLLWIFFAVLTHKTYDSETLQESSAPFFCVFEIRHLGRVHNYSLQCIDAGTFGLQSAISMNVGLCVVVAFSKLVHLVTVFGIQPLLKVNKIAAKMAERKLIESKDELGLRFGLSDLYFAILISGRDVSQQMRPKPEDRKEIPLYNSRPPSMIC